MSISYIVGFPVGSSASGVTSITTGTANATGGNLIVVAFLGSGQRVASSFQDSLSNVYVSPITGGHTGNGTELSYSYALNAAVSSSMTVTANSAGASCSVIAAAFNISSAALDKTGAWATGAGATATSGTTSTTTYANELLVGIAERDQASATNITNGASYSQAAIGLNTASGFDCLMEYQIVSSTGTYNATAGLGSSVVWQIVLITFGDLPSYSIAWVT